MPLTIKEIEEYNKILAESNFISPVLKLKIDIIKEANGSDFTYTLLPFHTSLDWLYNVIISIMEVHKNKNFIKAFEVSYNVRKDKFSTFITTVTPNNFYTVDDEDMIACLYLTLIDFIKDFKNE